MPLGVVFLSKLFFLVLWLKKEKDRKSQRSRERQCETASHPRGLAQPICDTHGVQTRGELVQGASTLFRQMFLHDGALVFFKCLLQAGSSTLPYTNTFFTQTTDCTAVKLFWIWKKQ